MIIPQCILDLPLNGSMKVSDLIGDCEPIVANVTDNYDFRGVWTELLEDAIHRGLPSRDLAQSVLGFLDENSEVEMLVWGKQKLSVLYSPSSQAGVVVISPDS